MFMDKFSAEKMQIAHSVSTETFRELKDENGNDLPMSDLELVQESDSYVRSIIDNFRPVAHGIFFDAALNPKKEYYVFDEERSLWHMPDQDFEKTLFNGRKRNEKILKDKMAFAWQKMFNDETKASLEARRLQLSGIFNWFKGFKNVGGKNVGGAFRSTISQAMKSRILPAVVLHGVVLLSAGLYVWAKFRDEYQPTIDGFRYRLGKPVLTGDVNVYLIWYGSWDQSSSRIDTMEYLANHISDSSWYNTMRDYYFQESEKSSKIYVNGSVLFKESYFDTYSRGKDLDELDPQLIIKGQLKGSPPDPNGIYFIFGSSDVIEYTTIANTVCGYHTYTTLLANYPTYYSYIMTPETDKRCQIQFPDNAVPPNSDLAIDSIASIFSHELVEVVSDPITSDPSWISSSGYENADLCAWTYGATKITSDGKIFNSLIGNRIYMLQQNLDITTQKCINGKNSSFYK